MSASGRHRQIVKLLSSLDQAERSGDAEAKQQAYEDLFSFCQENDLDLSALLRQPRREAAGGVLEALKALWPAS
jgi:hypothetical protein